MEIPLASEDPLEGEMDYEDFDPVITEAEGDPAVGGSRVEALARDRVKNAIQAAGDLKVKLAWLPEQQELEARTQLNQIDYALRYVMDEIFGYEAVEQRPDYNRAITFWQENGSRLTNAALYDLNEIRRRVHRRAVRDLKVKGNERARPSLLVLVSLLPADNVVPRFILHPDLLPHFGHNTLRNEVIICGSRRAATAIAAQSRTLPRKTTDGGIRWEAPTPASWIALNNAYSDFKKASLMLHG